MEQNYLPLFRKYRPQSFSDIVGQQSLVKALTNAIELNRIAQAYLFCGPRGTGKTSSARILAKSLNCIEGPTLTPCQKCASCVDITNATGLDVIEIDAASNRGIQDAKDLIAQAQYAPINGKYKIFIIDEVHMLSNDAFNALLKTFEEPPKNVIFILATTEPHKVLETIVSRCQRFDLRRITTDDIVKRLREISDLEKIKITDDALFTIAKNVSGGLRDSLALLDQVSILGVKEEITTDLIEELLGKVNFDTLLNLLEVINKGDIEQSIRAIDEIYTKGSEPRNLAENFIEFLRNVVLVLNSKNTDNISNFTTLIAQNIEKIKTSGFDKDKIARILNIVIEYYKEIKVSTNPYLWVELAAIAACRSDLEQACASAKKVIETSIANAPASAITPTAAIAANVVAAKTSSIAPATATASTASTATTISTVPTATSTASTTPTASTPAIGSTVTPTAASASTASTASTAATASTAISAASSATPTPAIAPTTAAVNPAATIDSTAASASPATAASAQIASTTPASTAASAIAPAQALDSAQLWTNIVTAIPSLPSRAFYSGVAKLVKIENNNITLGFLHENALAQAKSPSKLNALQGAIASVTPGYNVEFIKIDANTKVVEVHPKVAPAQPPKPPVKPQETFEAKEDEQREEKKEVQKKHYSPKVQEMIEQYNGKIIED